jgi:tartrate-resistant acid phosphatase type 5
MQSNLKKLNLLLVLLLVALVASCSGRRIVVGPGTPGKPPSLANRDLGSVLPERKSVHVLVLGDFGTGNRTQFDVAQVIADYHHSEPFDVALTVGDNFYNAGVASATDPIWAARFEKPYNSLGIKFFATLGNHDYSGSATSQVDYTKPEGAWQMPLNYYTYTAGPVQFFALDTALDSGAFDKPPTGLAADTWKEELKWLADQLKRKTNAKWRIAYGHRPIYSTGWHGDTPFLQSDLLPVLKDKIDVFLCGHDHDLEHLTDDKSRIEFFVSGGGGGSLRPLRHKTQGKSQFFVNTHGFMDLTADDKNLKANLINARGTIVHSASLAK